MSSVGDVNQSPILSAQAPRSCCHNKAQPITLIAVGVIVMLGAFFLILAANQVLPAGANPISNIGITKMWYPLFAIGLGATLFGSMNVYSKLEFTKQNVANVIDQLRKDLKTKAITTPDIPSPIYAYDLLTRMYSVQIPSKEEREKHPLFDINLHYALLRADNDLSHGIVQTLCSLKSPEDLKNFLLDTKKNIETILYHQVKHNIYQKTLLNSKRAIFYFATRVGARESSEDENKKKLEKHWQHYVVSEAFDTGREFNSRTVHKISWHARANLFACMINEQFKKKLDDGTFSNADELLQERGSIIEAASVQGWIEWFHSPIAEQSRKMWFRCQNNHFYIVHTANSEQKLLEFSTQYDFFKALENCWDNRFKITLFPQ